ncbi:MULTISPECIES: alpha/beta fold hydrolase [Burkholderia]|uniref:Alpha/beta hydrolase n=1 Tax=Burkholderia paludis TaxID=1506587 RepID=A0A6J5ENI5_9BURK|nr:MULTISPECIES: alpha/beta hydrolase [Burkholderia]CAB3766565.1 Non-heme bromoperoxidase BPO-A2 [Burkholderia paludis]VWC26644.1 alpha/beta hydrolase [Burkholderia paludis]
MPSSTQSVVRAATRPGTRLPGTPDPAHLWRTADGVRLAGDTWGHPDAPLVVLLHGGGQTRHAWGDTGALLGSAGYFAVAYDARGHGDSDWSAAGDYSQDAFVGDLRHVVDALGGRPPILVGASLGGGTGLVAIGERRIDARALILVDIVPYTEPAGVSRIRTFMQQNPDGFGSLDEVADAIGRYRSSRSRPRNPAGLSKNVRLGDDGRYHWHWDPRFLSGTTDLPARHARFSACARNLALPTLLVRGGSSDVVSEAGVREFLELCPHAEYVNVAAAGHMVAGDRNDVFGQAAAQFLARHVPAA